MKRDLISTPNLKPVIVREMKRKIADLYINKNSIDMILT